MSKWPGILSKLASEDSCKTKTVNSTFAVDKQRAAAAKCAVATSICSYDSQTMVATDIPKPLQTKCWKKFLPQFALLAPWLGLARNDKILSPVKKKRVTSHRLATCPSAVQHHNQIQQVSNTSIEEGSSPWRCKKMFLKNKWSVSIFCNNKRSGQYGQPKTVEEQSCVSCGI